MDNRLIAIQERMKEILRYNEISEQCEVKDSIFDSAQKKKNTRNENNWLLEEWRRISIPDWRRILQESIESHDTKREDYARWMLREILDDPDHQEDEE